MLLSRLSRGWTNGLADKLIFQQRTDLAQRPGYSMINLTGLRFALFPFALTIFTARIANLPLELAVPGSR
jgi:hypothetical protein